MRRVWSVDEIYERIETLDGDVVHYGDAVDETPLIAVRWRVDDAPRILLWGAPTGAELDTVPLALELAAWWRDAGWEVWLVPILDPAGGRGNEAILDPGTEPRRAVDALRRAWAPGEAVEEWLPVSENGFWQPAGEHPNAPIPTRPEALGLWRLIHHCQPDITVSLHEHLAGGAAVGCSQGVLVDDVEALLERTRSIHPVHAGAKILVGRQLAQHPNVIVLPTLEEEAERIGDETGSVLVGGAAFWQTAPGISWQLWLPRWRAPDLDSDVPIEGSRSVTYAGEQRERNGKLVPVQITLLDRPGHPAHGREIRTVDLKRTESAAVGAMPDQPVLSGWLAVEAWYERQEVLLRASEVVEGVRAHEDRPAYERAAQLLKWALRYEDHLLRSYLQNKRYGRRASESERSHWDVSYRLETTSMIAEAQRLVATSDQRDVVVRGGVEALAGLIDEHFPSADLTLLPFADRSRWLVEWSEWCVATRAAGGFEAARRGDRLERAQKQLGVAKRESRNAKNLKLPRAEQAERVERVRMLTELVKELEEPQGAPSSEVVATPSSEPRSEDVETATSDRVEAPPERGVEVDDRPPAPPSVPLSPAPEALSPDRVRLTPRLREELESMGMAATLLERFNARGIPRSMLVELDIEVPPSNDEPVSVEDPEGAEVEPEAPSDDPALEPADEPDDPPERDRSPTTDEGAPPERVPMTAAIRERLVEEGLPPVIIDRLEGEGIPRTLVEHLRIEVETEPEPQQPMQEAVEEEPLGEEEVDLDVLLPPQLLLDPEWGRGPIRWEDHLPETHERPFAAMVERLTSGEAFEAPSVTQLQVTDGLDVVEPTVLATVADIQETGFLRRRVELRTISRSSAPLLPYPSPTGGSFRHRRRILGS